MQINLLFLKKPHKNASGDESHYAYLCRCRFSSFIAGIFELHPSSKAYMSSQRLTMFLSRC